MRGSGLVDEGSWPLDWIEFDGRDGCYVALEWTVGKEFYLLVCLVVHVREIDRGVWLVGIETQNYIIIVSINMCVIILE